MDFYKEMPLQGRGYGYFFLGSMLQGVGIHVNGLPLVEGLHYKKLSRMVALPEGGCQVDVYDGGEWIGTRWLQIEKEHNYLIAITVSEGKAEIVICGFDDSVPRGESVVKFLHLAPQQQALDISVHKGDVVFPGLQYLGVTHVLRLTPAHYNLEARLNGTKTIVLPMHDSFFEENKAYLICILQDEAVFIIEK
ncbi:hypothetical protein A8F94_02870 [Bacillus sp. FJAT-27225]|uniref:DUF4397 domain-containing protein n=1 Tax=Bacillus sp. FJAT-27225 TaxID=1743144 RepID=UPI00080C32C1|nr:DUF4397 domain-containing protein [Bacillus sp. FJAT-27225]OCA90833.1 hypothetical protein A8F94_02870 [Bacillus sp. FJAT-27225]